MTKNEMIVKILQAREKAYIMNLNYAEAVYGKDSSQASKEREIFCECLTILNMMLGTEEEVSKYYDIWYK